MDRESTNEMVRKAILEGLKDPSVIQAFATQILPNIIAPAIEQALVPRDEEMAALKHRFAEKTEQMEKQLAEKTEQMEKLEVLLDNQEQYSRKYCINIRGIPQTLNENVVEIVCDFANSMGVQLMPRDIDVAHRLQPGPQRTGDESDICVKLLSYAVRQALWEARIKLRNSGSGIYLYENVTRRRQYILYIGRQMKRDGLLARVWSDGGVLKVKKYDNSRTRIINSVDELTQIADEDRHSNDPVRNDANAASTSNQRESANASNAPDNNQTSRDARGARPCEQAETTGGQRSCRPRERAAPTGDKRGGRPRERAAPTGDARRAWSRERATPAGEEHTGPVKSPGRYYWWTIFSRICY